MIQMSKNLLIGALYIRVSTHSQDELSPDAQKRLLLDYSRKNDILIPEDFIFIESISGRNVKNRHEFQKMISLAKSQEHPIDVILVWKFSRFARNQEESIVYKSMLKKDHVDVISISEPLIDGPFGSLIERIIEWMDEYYSIRLSGEVLRGMKEKSLKEGYQTSPPLGYRAVGKGQPFVIDENEFKIVSCMCEQYDRYNKDFTSIARYLNSMGYKTRRGNAFEARSVKRILQNPFYYGLVSWNGINFIGTHEVRFTQEQFDTRIKKMQSRYRPAKRREVSTCKHWLSGLLKCGYCGATMIYNSANHSPGFQCYRYAKGFHSESCSISEKKVTAAVFEYFEELLSGIDFKYTYHLPEPKETTANRTFLEKSLLKLSDKECRIALAFENGIDTMEEYAENKKRLKKEHEKLKKELDALNHPSEDFAKSSKSNVMVKARTVYDLIKNPDVDSEIKGNIIRDLIECIVYDKETHSLIFHLYLS